MFDFQSCTIFFFIWLVSILLVRAIFTRARPKLHLPPSPLALPIIGHLHLLGPLPHRSFFNLSQRYGPLIYLRFGSVPAVLASSAETAKEIFKAQELSFVNRPENTAVRYLSYDVAGFIFASYGPYWKFMKKLCMSDLLGGRNLEVMRPIRCKELHRFLKALFKKAHDGDKVDVGVELISMASNMMSRMLMSRSCSNTDSEAVKVTELVHEVMALTGKFNVADFIGACKNLDLQGLNKRCKDVRERFDEMMEKIIDEHQEKRKNTKNDEGGEKDLLDILLEIYEDENAEIRLTMENIKAFILDLFTAGTDTSAITIEWALAELLNHPNILKKASEEVDTVVGMARLVEESDIPDLPYIQAIIKETLRLHPAAPIIFRQSRRDSQIIGYDIPGNTSVFINVWAIGRDSKYWEDHLEFQPERFIKDDGNHNKVDLRGQNLNLLPFGSGRRGCPGYSLALNVVHTTLAAVIQCFEWKVVPVGKSSENIVVDMTEGPGITLPRATPLVCSPLARFDLSKLLV